MKKSILRLTLAAMLLINAAGIALAQQPQAQKDTVNADKAAKPVFYQAAEEENSNSGVNPLVYVAVGVVVVAGVVFFLRARKNKK
ncbi:MAG: hypothetical protein LWW85_00325 [Marinilabiliales bacterium]|nr:hypothetical protein [Marinilabiliales bacterium]